MKEKLHEKLASLPGAPGCYLMKDNEGQIIYVGKAINLQKRVRSYFRPTASLDSKTAALVEKVVDFDFIVVANETEALILEANLIKEHSPHYNILLRDDKHYPYLRLTVNEPFPRLLVARRVYNDGSRYFGPYPAVGSIRQLVNTIHEIIPLRRCSVRSWPQGQRACLNAHIGRCLAPCEGRVSEQQYAEVVEDALNLLQGRTAEINRRLTAEMEEASRQLRFEDAARLRDIIAVLDKIGRKQRMDRSAKGGNYDLLAAAAADGHCVVQVFFVRGGQVIGREHFTLTNGFAGEEPLLLRRFIQEYYSGDNMPSYIYCNKLPEDVEVLNKLCATKFGHKVSFVVPCRGDKLRLIRLVEENARLLLDQYLNSRERRQQKAALALEGLRQLLALPSTPRRIECFDISHIQGSNMVGSMTVAINGCLEPSEYRRFKIKTLEGSNDFAALQEVLERRWRRGMAEIPEGKQPRNFSDLPDLTVIDGGKGQLSSVVERLREIEAPMRAVIALAKENEEIFTVSSSQPICLDRQDPALQLLQNLRDEAHRFAITYHRQLRGHQQTASILDQVPQLGPTRRQSLLKTFGSLAQIKAASEQQLAAAPKMTKAAAAACYKYLHSDGESDN